MNLGSVNCILELYYAGRGSGCFVVEEISWLVDWIVLFNDDTEAKYLSMLPPAGPARDETG